MEVLHLDSETFNTLIDSSELPVLVEFGAEWCAPCKMMAPILDRIAKEHTDFLVAKVDVDDSPDIAEGLRSVPTFRVYKDGKVLSEFTGAQPYAALLKTMQSLDV